MGRKRNKKGAKDDVNAAEVAMEKAVRRVQEILRDHSEQEIRATLLQCNLNYNVAIDRLLSLQDTSNEQGASTQLTDSSTTTSSVLVPNQSSITNGVTRGVPISSTEAAPSLPVPSSSDVTNAETRTVPISSPEAVPPLSVPSSRALTNVKPNRQDTRMITASGLPMDEPSKQNVTKAPVKADSPLHQKPDATNPVSNSFTESDAARDPQNSAFLRNARQSIATASLLGPRPLTSMADAFGAYPSSKPQNNQQGMNRGQVPSGQYGNMMNSSYWRPNQNESYDMAPFQQRGGGSNSNTLAHHGNMMTSPYTWLEPDDDTSIYQSLDSVFAPYRNRTLPMSATSTVPSSHGSAYGVGMLSGNAANSRVGYGDVSRNHLPSNSSGTSSIGPSSHRSAFGFDMTSGNGSNSWLGYEDISRTILPSNSSGTSRVPSSHSSDYGRGMSSGNGSNSRLGYEEDISRIHMPSIQGRSPFVWRTVQGEDSLLSKQDTSNEQGASTHLTDSSTTTTTTSSVLVPNQSDLPNVPASSGEAVPLSSEPSSSAITNGETRGVPISTNEAVPSLSVPSSSDVTNGETRSLPISFGEAVPPLSVPSSSDITNGETRSETISSSAAAPSLPVPSTRAPTNVKIKRQVSRMISASDPSWADVFRGLHKKPDATNQSSNSLTEESNSARREPNPQHSAFPVNQSMDTRQQSTATASLLGPRPPTSMADLDSFFSSAGFQKRSGSNSYTLAYDGNMMNPHYLWRQAQNNVPSSEASQQHGGTDNDTSLYQSLDSVFSQYRNNTLPLSASSSVPSSHGSDYGFDMTSGNAANSRLWSGSIPRVQLPSDPSGGASSIGLSWHVNGSNSRLGYGDYLPPVHLQGSRSSNEWTVQSEESYFIPSHWRLPGYLPSQQEREAYRSFGFERLRAYNASLNQENSTSDPSDQTKQRPGDK